MMSLPPTVTSASQVDEMLVAIVRFTQDDLPFVAQVAQLARQTNTLDHLEAALVSLYRLGLEHHEPYVTDLTDELLSWVEQQLDAIA